MKKIYSAPVVTTSDVVTETLSGKLVPGPIELSGNTTTTVRNFGFNL